ncbi:carbohydrate ABC transporter permease [Alteribacter keqinensis]|uniref:Carbohydrate ABC transporter permease n=1 Tax=Alteribacter keqinensis TaxID=2483800 RepID=A0A3M7TQD9_9BACI|nr:carbohydrate ABC transporter permease [Alteribacter keqinensis]RNA67675.1 carbohydrate ABC transporter permease [Alteribacter keqinensis]
MSGQKSKWLKRGAVHGALITFFLILMAPVIVAFSTSLETFQGAMSWPPSLIKENPQWINYAEVWSGRYNFSGPFFNSLIIGASTVVLTILLAFPAAYAIAKFTFIGRGWLLFIVLMTQMFSPVVLIVGLYQQIQAYQLLNTLTGIVITNCAFTIPLSVWLLHGFLKNIPEELEEAAFVDGCSRVKGIIRIVIPLSAPGIAMAAIYSYIWSWNDLLIPLIYITDSSLRPVSLALTDFAGQNTIYWHEMMAASIIATVPIAIMFAFVQKYFVQGFTAGAIKG